ncbi:MAG: D-alanyl-D-alanine carboxypeptidase/D-alanyl-D-alanine endopeptidase [Thainema sp.]
MRKPVINLQKFGCSILIFFLIHPLAKSAIAQFALPTEQLPAAICPDQLATAIEPIIQQPQLARSRWGILVETLEANPEDRQTLYELEADRYFIPASTVKLMTTAAALRILGSDFHIRTSVYQIPTRPDQLSYLGADEAAPSESEPAILRVVGRGDPSFDSADLADLAQQIRDRTITHIDQLQLDDTYFQGLAIHPNWEWEDVQAGYGTAVNSLILNENEVVVDLLPQSIGEPLRVQWRDPNQATQWQVENSSTTVAATEPEFVRAGRSFQQPILQIWGQLQAGAPSEDVSVSVFDPVENFGQGLEQALAEQDITVGQIVIVDDPNLPSNSQEIAAVSSPPLRELITTANQQSNNLFAEALLRHLGHYVLAASPTDSTAAGLETLETALTNLGVDPTSYDIADGSGLSRHNLVSPAALVETLQNIAASPDAELYRQSLAVAGESGTLQNRLADSAIAGRLWGKSGAVSGNISLAGYLEPPNYDPLAFSILINQSDLRGSELRQAIDQVLLQLARLQGCTAEAEPAD